jgi:hypothetical protein
MRLPKLHHVPRPARKSVSIGMLWTVTSHSVRPIQASSGEGCCPRRDLNRTLLFRPKSGATGFLRDVR